MLRYLVFWTGLLACSLGIAAELPPGPLQESDDSDIGYPTVAEALTSLRSNSAVTFTTLRGWTIVTDMPHRTIWSFAPKGYPAYPAVVKRYVTEEENGYASIQMELLCEADKAPCDELFREFYRINPIFSSQPVQTPPDSLLRALLRIVVPTALRQISGH